MDVIKLFKQSYIGLKLREKRYYYTYKRKDARMVAAIQRYKICKEKKPLVQIKKEINLCRKYWGCYPLHYFRYDLYRKDKQLSDKELLDYIPEFFFYNIFLPHYDTNKYEILIGDKNIAEQIFRSLNIKQPNTICKLINGEILNKELETIKEFSIIEKKLLEKKYKKIFVKPVDGQGGDGIYIFNKSKDEYFSKNGIKFNEDFLENIGAKKNYIVQFGINQDEELNSIYDKSVNTFRIITENKNNKVRIVCATLRIGSNGKEVDNFCNDGFMVSVDEDTGKLGSKIISYNGTISDTHPDSSFCFKDFKLSKWEQIKIFAINSSKKMNQFTYLGWDIALEKNGPLAIEANLFFGLDGIQICNGDLRKRFYISNVKDFWKRKLQRKVDKYEY